jgi:hypothetical protein
MANKLLLRILVSARPGIRQGVLKMQDVVSEYFKQTGGRTIDAGDRAIIENEFIEFAPSNVSTPDAFKGFLDEGEIVNQPSTKPTIAQDKINYKGMEDQLGTKLRGDETFDELLEIEKNKTQDQGLGSMVPKEYYGYNRKGSEFSKIPSPVHMDDIIASERVIDKSNIKNWGQRDDYAKFIKKMRDKDFKNPDIRNIVTKSGGDIAEGKRSATTLARAADMGADTKIKQEILSDLDADKLERGPKWWKGDDKYEAIEGPMGKDDFAEFSESLVRKVNGGVMDDLDIMIGEDKTNAFFRFIDQNQFKNDPDAFVQSVKAELESSGIKYDMTFWEKYVDEIMQLTTADVPMFNAGGLV